MGYSFILVYLILILLVLRISTKLLVMTGLEPSQSSFQTVSMLTGAGFTTSESELILRHPVRRRIGMALILFGAFSLAVLISVISNLLSQHSHMMVLIPGAVLLTLFLLALKHPAVNSRVSHWIASRLPSRTEGGALPVEELADDERNEDVVGVQIAGDSGLIGRTLREALPKGDEVVPLVIKRDGGKIRNERWDTKLQKGDFILLYGDESVIESCCNVKLQ
ncbi:TrkA C-terminal domain-containing protein [Paenibacillus pasadenensis]|uniref:TrkA C-terminal domain-containing protein n=1 Tax=Paenibacillus pasadenensis TaxID=217090 RepID=UPI002040495E|nr:TrkA C-terminal domain-containing protein [Paenibacillus pasadenensis]